MDGVPRCRHELTGRWAGSEIVVSIKGAALVERMVAGRIVCLRRLLPGDRALEVRFNRFLGHDKVRAERISESWGESMAATVESRHVLAIQDTSEIHFNTTPQRRRRLGEIGKDRRLGRDVENRLHVPVAVILVPRIFRELERLVRRLVEQVRVPQYEVRPKERESEAMGPRISGEEHRS
ncbi:hypothetical protein AB7535_22705 [Bradyrhizobium sp. 956_D2_N1_4]|uniref:hypothetical protein n=1 Tax=Bradyrhizobium sp. 956_D2_N1_4 TaxID=3240375 RepID=UPI003F8B92BA